LLIGTGASMNRDCRVVISGIGIVAPNGIGLDAFWSSLLAGESGIDRISRFDASDYPIRVSGEIKDFRLSDFVEQPVRPNRMARHTQLALAAARLAITDARLDQRTLLANAPLSVVMGVGSGSIEMIARSQARLDLRGPAGVSPYAVSACQPHAVASALGIILDVDTRMLTVSSACAAGLDAVEQARQIILRGKADMVITGGADSAVSELAVAGLHAGGLVPSLNGEDPKTVSRPFDRCRKGGIMAEGAGILVIERLESALARGVTPYMEILGYGSSVDRMGEDPASGLAVSMQEALYNASLRSESIDYVCAHGPSDITIDRVETEMIKRVFGKRAYRVPVTSIKGATGNPLSAAGPHQLTTCAMIMGEGRIPPTTNYQYPDPDCDLDYVGDGPRNADVQTALVNLHGLGGGNSTMVVGRASES
jgi:3-oxoacyl-[acyl-carrier-protein] synthase II